ncbi:MAG: signal peptide peptidase SppA [Nitrospirae bacterium CG_4_10_14_3_um_filter_44_29]|nr:signal peptide peptidase SppA [Nitrospirota bacterium]OIO29560.1 MAG: S49 family peptidase [Nitrospirae bacterium CG1_02_44_142]PIP71379.1 MAG: signal peptide peptidase SppA [Nitrospirae bacterium CG22_combo_CG10-13_8_21_14_all_44_11]PIV40542.1 MAG: signal peptide peptidase SppA [Nitrospirae bacterium CG02_land_8_20_14_3_00_44_33]PIV66132.1 MAG: signal peptide peptidase SppA [Nitrospirae bacterium CG01_land_8_20_14_3_00_44_22]PIW88906.1 MAG: signal peptide peptidase SppA [Nitrospirae bacter
MKKACLIITGFLTLLIVISALFAVFQKNVPLGEKVAVVRIEGPIMDAKNTVDEIKGYLKDASIKALVLRVDSPGGAVAPSQEIYEEVKKAALKKKVIVSMGSVAASGGYYISAPADRIIANPGTLTGSIGVIMEIPNIEGLMNKIGVKTEVIKSGRHKDLASAFRKMEKEERLILQGVLDDVHEQFIKAVSDGRKIPFDEVKKLADGRIFTGRQAMKVRLVDELGTLEDAVAAAGRLAGIKGEPEVVTKKERFSLFDILRGKFPKELSDIFPTVKIKYMLAP